MPVDDDLVKELRSQLEREKELREELVEQLRESRQEQEAEPEPTGVERIRNHYAEADQGRRRAKEGGDG